MFKTLIASAAIAATSFVAPAAVEAATSHCYTTTNYDTVCIHSVRNHKRYGAAYKLVTSTVNGGSYATTEIDCTTASSYNYKRNMAGIACYEFN